MNSGNASFVTILRILLVLAVLGAALFLLLGHDYVALPDRLLHHGRSRNPICHGSCGFTCAPWLV